MSPYGEQFDYPWNRNKNLDRDNSFYWKERFRGKEKKNTYFLYFSYYYIHRVYAPSFLIFSSIKILYSFNIRQRIYFLEHYMKQYSNSMNNSLCFIRFSKKFESNNTREEKNKRNYKVTNIPSLCKKQYSNKKLLNTRQYALSKN